VKIILLLKNQFAEESLPSKFDSFEYYIINFTEHTQILKVFAVTGFELNLTNFLSLIAEYTTGT